MIKPLPPSIFRENSRRYGFLLFLFLSFFLSVGAFAQTVTSDKDDYAPGSIATIIGSGWTQDQMVHVEFKEEPEHPDYHVYDNVAVDANGNWQIKYNVEERHLGVKFTVNVLGKQSGATSTTIFTDAGIGSVNATGSTFCTGQPIAVNFTTNAAGGEKFVSGATFIAELTNSTGTTNLGEIGHIYDEEGGNKSFTINGTVPLVNAGSTYRVRVRSINPETNIPFSTSNLQINASPTTADAGTDQLNVNAISTTLGGNTPSVGSGTWTIVSGLGGSLGTPSSPTSTFTGTAGTTYKLKWTISSTSCGSSSDEVDIKFNQIPTSTSTTSPTSTYGSTSVTLSATVKPNPGGGSVNFFVNTTKVGTGTIGEGGVATYVYNPSSLNASSATNVYTIKADFSGSGFYTTSTTAPSNNGVLTVNPKPVVVTPTAGQTKMYGANDPTFAYTPSEALLAGNSFSGALARAEGSNVGEYAYTLGTLGAGNNYTVTLATTNNKFAITTKPVVVTPAALSKIYGAADPAFTFANDASLAASAFTGSLAREAGINVSEYNYTLGNLSAGTNYSLSLGGSNKFAITARPVTITAAAKTKVYGEADPALTYAITTGTLAYSDAFTGALTREAGNGVGTYAIEQGTVALNSNYALTYKGADLTITARPITVTADAQTKVYGNVDPALTYKVTSGSLVTGDAFTGALSRATGESVGTYAINKNTLSAGTNYDLTYAGANLVIGTREITITAIANSKYCGQVDPSLSYNITSGTLVNGDTFNGSLVRAVGESVGTYGISSTLTNSNYSITFIPASFIINGVTIDASASSNAVQVSNKATLSATVTSISGDVLSGINVSFMLNGSFVGTGITSESGIATFTTASGLSLGFYKVEATTGTGCGTAIAYLPVYDPNSASVTGGGWFDSPRGAYKVDPTMIGKANFGFNAQYKKGSNIPTGNTEFQFHAGNLNFKSTNYTSGSLVVAGAKAIFKGTGTINGSGEFGFMISAVDGSVSGGNGADKFRMKIWKIGGDVVYDNEMSVDENSVATTLLGGGSIVIHEVKANTKSERVADAVDMFTATKATFKTYPNPVRDNTTIEFAFAQDEAYSLEVYNVQGELVKQLPGGQAKANTPVQVKWDATNTAAGVYIVRLVTNSGVQNLRVVRE